MICHSFPCRTFLTKGYAIVLLTAALEFLLAGFFTGLYYSNHTSAVYAMTLSGIRWGSLFLLLQILASIFSSYYQALGRIKAVNMFSLMEGIAVMGPLAIVLVPRMGLDGLWITMLTGYADNKPHAVDVRVVHKSEDLILRVKDDCAPFNPQERAELLDTQDMTRNIGLRMVMRIAKSVDYQNLLGLNVLTMRV